MRVVPEAKRVAGWGRRFAPARPGVQSEDTLSRLDVSSSITTSALMLLWNTFRLKSANPEMRRKAIESLKPSDARAQELLRAGLSDDDARVRCAAVKVFAQGKDDKSVEALVVALHDPSSEVREAAAQGLTNAGDDRAQRQLVNLLKDSHPGVRRAAAGALRGIGWKPPTTEEQALFDVGLGHARAAAFAGQAAVKALVTELKHDTSFKRRAAAEALEEVDDPRAREPLLAALHDEDPTVRVSAIHALGKDYDGDVTARLLGLFHDADRRVKLAAAEVLARRADPAFAADFLGLLSDGSFEVRLTAVQFLGRVRDPALAEALLPLLADPDSDVRQAVAQSLGTIGAPVAIEALVLALTDEERAVRQSAELALGRIDSHWAYSEAAQRASAQLETFLNDQRGWVRSAAATVLAKLQTPTGSVQAAG